MQERGWTRTHQLRSHFLKRVQDMLRELGRDTGAWEEAALGGGIDPGGSYLVAWRRAAHGRRLAERGYDVVMAPAERCYLDMGQSDEWWEPGGNWAGTVTAEAAYSYDPGGDWPDPLKARLLGVQANLWGENLHERRLLDHMLFPRLSALAETAWTAPAAKDFRRFSGIEPLMPRTGER
jgi:hexosaminidase